MHNIDMDSIVEYAIEKVKTEIKAIKGSKIVDVDIDDVAWGEKSYRFDVIGYNKAGRPISYDTFTGKVDFEDAPGESEEDAKWLVDNAVGEFAYNFVKHPNPPSDEMMRMYDLHMREEIMNEEYNIQFYQIFSNPERPTDNGKMIAQAGTEDEAKAKGDKLVGKGNYLIKAVCDDGKVRDVDLHDYFNKSKDLKEYYRGEDALDDVISWLQDHEQAWNDFTTHFSDVEDEDLTYDMVVDWISEHDTLYDDYLAFFDLDESKSINESVNASQEPQMKWCVEIEGDFPAGCAFDTSEQAQQWFSDYVKKYNDEHAEGEENYTEDDFEVYIYQDIDTVDKDELIKYLADYFEDTYRYEYTYYKRFVGDIVNLLYDVYDLPSYAREDMEYDAYQWAYSMCEILEDRVGPIEDDEYEEDDDLEESKSMNKDMNTYNVTFYMDSLDDNVMSGPSTTKQIVAASKEDAEKKLRDECNDKYYIPTITDVELVESIVTEELKPGDRVYVTVSNRQGNVIKMVSDDVVEVELDGGLYPARIDRFYVDEVKVLDMQPEVDDEIDYDDVDPDAVIDSLKEELTADEVRSRVSNYLKSHQYSLTDTMDEEDICAEICDNLFDMNYNTMPSDLSHAVFTEVMNYFEEDLEEDLGHTIGTALFCTASIEVCTIGGVDEDGEDVDEPVIFDDKTPVNTILAAIDPDTDAGDAKCAEINQLLNAMPDGYIQVQAYCRGRDMGDRQVYDAYELYDEIRDIFNLDESLTESNNAYTYRGHYIINDGSTWMIKDGNNQVIRSGIATDSEAEEIIDDLDESVDYEDAFVADDDM